MYCNGYCLVLHYYYLCFRLDMFLTNSSAPFLHPLSFHLLPSNNLLIDFKSFIPIFMLIFYIHLLLH